MSGGAPEPEVPIAVRVEELRVMLHADREWREPGIARALVRQLPWREIEHAAQLARAAYVDGKAADPVAYFIGIARRLLRERRAG